MNASQIQDIQHHVKVYIRVFLALLAATLITVAISYVPLGEAGNIVAALVIAVAKASLVAGFFMHLASEKKTIYTFLVFTVIFFAGLMFLTLFSTTDLVALKHVS